VSIGSGHSSRDRSSVDDAFPWPRRSEHRTEASNSIGNLIVHLNGNVRQWRWSIFGLHYGQIVYVTKALRGADLGFYRELDKTGYRTGSGQPET